MRNRLNRRYADGASSVEYGLIVALIAAVIVASVIMLGGTVTNLFDSTCTSLRDNGPITSTCN